MFFERFSQRACLAVTIESYQLLSLNRGLHGWSLMKTSRIRFDFIVRTGFLSWFVHQPLLIKQATKGRVVTLSMSLNVAQDPKLIIWCIQFRKWKNPQDSHNKHWTWASKFIPNTQCHFAQWLLCLANNWLMLSLICYINLWQNWDPLNNKNLNKEDAIK